MLPLAGTPSCSRPCTWFPSPSPTAVCWFLPCRSSCLRCTPPAGGQAPRLYQCLGASLRDREEGHCLYHHPLSTCRSAILWDCSSKTPLKPRMVHPPCRGAAWCSRAQEVPTCCSVEAAEPGAEFRLVSLRVERTLHSIREKNRPTTSKESQGACAPTFHVNHPEKLAAQAWGLWQGQKSLS